MIAVPVLPQVVSDTCMVAPRPPPAPRLPPPATVTATASRAASAAVALAEEPLVLALAGVQHLTRWLLALPRTLLLPPRSSRDAASLPREFEIFVSRRSCLRVSASTSVRSLSASLVASNRASSRADV